MSITQDISQITHLSAFTSPNRPAEVDNLVENELPNLTTELQNLIPQINSTNNKINNSESNVLALRNETENIRNLANTQTQEQVALATTQAGIATTKASEANNSANQALTYKNQIQSYVIPAGTSYSVDQINTQNSAMTKAQFNALAEERKANRAGSGFDSFGKHNITIATNIPVNKGMWTVPTIANQFILGSESSNVGVSVTQVPNICINGIKHTINKVNSNAPFSPNVLQLPTAPNIYPYDTVLTAEQINSGVIKHADSSNSGLIVNGKFTTDTSGWTEYDINRGYIINENGRLKIGVDISNGVNPFAYQDIPTIIGKKYIIECNIETSNGFICRATSVDFNTILVVKTTTIASTTREVLEFTATETVTRISMYNASSVVNSYTYFDNVAVFPADAISRSDLSMAESFHEDIAEKGFGYPLGNTQYLGGNTDGLTGIANGNFTGFETYSLFGNWQTPSALIGKGYVWSTLTEAQKKAFIANPENNCYLDGDKVIQVRYRIRVVQGLGDNWAWVDANTVQQQLMYSTDFRVKPKGKLTTASDIGAYNFQYNSYYATYGEGSNPFKDIGVFTAMKSISPYTLDTHSYDSKCFALPIALVSRRNQGLYHPVYNANGSKKASDGNFWYNTAVSFTSISDCFDPAKLLTASGYIGTVSGRPDGLLYDQVHEGDILDLRNSSKKVEDYNRLISREFNKLVAGTNRGKEGAYSLIPKKATQYYKYTATKIRFYLGTSATSGTTLPGNTGLYSKKTHKILVVNKDDGTYCIGDIDQYSSSTGEIEVGYIYTPFNTLSGSLTTFITPTNGLDVYIIGESTRTKSNTLLHCDIIGNPTNYPTSWKQNGVFGTPLIVAEDGTSLLPNGVLDTFKLSRKANATPLLCLRSTDNGATWTSFTPTFSTTTNAITLTDEPAANLVMVYYQTHTSMAIPVTNSEVLEIGEVFSTNGLYTAQGSSLVNNLIGKTPVGVTSPLSLFSGKNIGYKFYNSPNEKIDIAAEYKPIHTAINLGNTTSPTCKMFPYLTRLNGKAYLNLVFKEMKYNTTASQWGDDTKFDIVDNVSTTTDFYGNTVLIGQKTVELPYFIDLGE